MLNEPRVGCEGCAGNIPGSRVACAKALRQEARMLLFLFLKELHRVPGETVEEVARDQIFQGLLQDFGLKYGHKKKRI